MSGDNFHFDLTAVAMDKCLDIAFLGAPGGKAQGWAEMDRAEGKGKRLVLFWSDDKAATQLPAPLNAEAVEPFVLAWLNEQDYGREPSHDGENDKGWRIYNETWGHLAGNHVAFVAIEPEWIMYGK